MRQESDEAAHRLTGELLIGSTGPWREKFYSIKLWELNFLLPLGLGNPWVGVWPDFGTRGWYRDTWKSYKIRHSTTWTSLLIMRSTTMTAIRVWASLGDHRLSQNDLYSRSRRFFFFFSYPFYRSRKKFSHWNNRKIISNCFRQCILEVLYSLAIRRISKYSADCYVWNVTLRKLLSDHWIQLISIL